MAHCLFGKASLSVRAIERFYLFGFGFFRILYVLRRANVHADFVSGLGGPGRDVVCLVFGACTRTGPWPVVMSARARWRCSFPPLVCFCVI